VPRARYAWYESYIQREFNEQCPVKISKNGLMGLSIEDKYGDFGVNMLVHALATERFGQPGLGVTTLVDMH
jgi:hypothetical protein